jgi:hypothetical protein
VDQYSLSSVQQHSFRYNHAFDHPINITNAAICAKQRDGVNTYAALMIGSYSSTGGGLTTGTPGIIYYHSSNSQTVGSSMSSKLVVANQWTHIAVTFTSTVVNIYINGVLNTTTTTNGSIPADTTSTSCAIGAWYASGSVVSAFNGYIDDFSVWNVPLSDKIINTVYNSQIAGIPSAGTNTRVTFNAQPNSNIIALGGGSGGEWVYPATSGGSGGGGPNQTAVALGAGGSGFAVNFTKSFPNCVLYFPFSTNVSQLCDQHWGKCRFNCGYRFTNIEHCVSSRSVDHWRAPIAIPVVLISVSLATYPEISTDIRLLSGSTLPRQMLVWYGRSLKVATMVIVFIVITAAVICTFLLEVTCNF